MYDPYGDFASFTLPNGLTVHHQYWDRPWVRAGFLVHAGARDDPKGKEGIAHFAEHLMSVNVPGCSEERIYRYFEGQGGGVSLGKTGYLATTYAFFASNGKKELRRAFSLFGSMLCAPELERRIEEERKIISQEYRQSYPAEHHLEWYLRWHRLLYGTRKLAAYSGALGRIEAIRSIGREDLQSFCDRYYRPANIEVVCVGGVSRDELAEYLLQGSWGASPPGKRNSLPGIIKPQLPLAPEVEFYLSDVVSVPVDRSEIMAAWTLPANVDRIIVDISSRALREVVHRELRGKRQLVYSTSLERTSYGSIIDINVSAKIPTDRIDQVRRIITRSVASIGREKGAFEKARRFYIKGKRMSDPNSCSLVENSFSDLAFFHRIVSLAELKSRLERIDAGQVSAFAREWLTPERQLTVLWRA